MLKIGMCKFNNSASVSVVHSYGECHSIGTDVGGIWV